MGVKDISGAFHSSEHACDSEIIAPQAETKKNSSNVECQTTWPHQIKKKSYEARTGFDVSTWGFVELMPALSARDLMKLRCCPQK